MAVSCCGWGREAVCERPNSCQGIDIRGPVSVLTAAQPAASATKRIIFKALLILCCCSGRESKRMLHQRGCTRFPEPLLPGPKKTTVEKMMFIKDFEPIFLSSATKVYAAPGGAIRSSDMRSTNPDRKASPKCLPMRKEGAQAIISRHRCPQESQSARSTGSMVGIRPPPL
jgi:hypothetical protein